jgi:hypothetical protein
MTTTLAAGPNVEGYHAASLADIHWQGYLAGQYMDWEHALRTARGIYGERIAEVSLTVYRDYGEMALEKITFSDAQGNPITVPDITLPYWTEGWTAEELVEMAEEAKDTPERWQWWLRCEGAWDELSLPNENTTYHSDRPPALPRMMLIATDPERKADPTTQSEGVPCP